MPPSREPLTTLALKNIRGLMDPRRASVTFCLAVCAAGCGRDGAVVTQHNDTFRTGAQLAETTLTPGAVRRLGMRVKYTALVDGNINGQPLYARGVSFPDGRANALYVVTSENTAYAFVAGTGAQKWMHRLLDSDLSRETGRPLTRGDTNPPVTPVIDVFGHTMYVVFSTKNQPVDQFDPSVDKITRGKLRVAYWLV